MMSQSAFPSLCLRSSSPFGARSLVSLIVSENAAKAAALEGSCLRTPLNSVVRNGLQLHTEVYCKECDYTFDGRIIQSLLFERHSGPVECLDILRVVG